jgi:hypothetical protein
MELKAGWEEWVIIVVKSFSVSANVRIYAWAVRTASIFTDA